MDTDVLKEKILREQGIRYSQANQALLDGDYDAAYRLFTNNNGFRDSEEMATLTP